MQAEAGEGYDEVAQADLERAAGGVLISNLVKGAELAVEDSGEDLSVSERLIKRIELNYENLERNETTVLLSNLVHTRAVHETDPELRAELEKSALTLYEHAIGDKRNLEYRNQFERQALEYSSDLRVRRAIMEYNEATTDEERDAARQRIFTVQENQAAELSMRFRLINRPNERAEWLGRMRVRDYLLSSPGEQFAHIAVERALPYERNPIIQTSATHEVTKEDGIEVRVEDHGFDSNTVLIRTASPGRDESVVHAFATTKRDGVEINYPAWIRPIVHDSDEARQQEVANMLYTLYSASAELQSKFNEGHTLEEMVNEARQETGRALAAASR
ncbi:MAG: hypothetical protein R3313_00465 [Candidatus Saccharimonadales bacterium]|nr:hypothetical protein [Candidatus Saccharimonadales bacterium]